MMTAPMMLCRYLPIFGPNSTPAPIWGDRESLACLANTLNTGLTISETPSPTRQSEAPRAIQTALTRLQQAGRIPHDLSKVQNLSDDQRSALGFEPRILPPGSSMQDWGVPPFQELDLADVLAGLRFIARFSELKCGYKPVFQVGIITMIAQGVEPQFFAQLFVSDAGLVTDTIWLYRLCVVSLDDDNNGGAAAGSKYVEHWCAFDNDNVFAEQQHSSRQDLSSTSKGGPATTTDHHTQTTITTGTDPNNPSTPKPNPQPQPHQQQQNQQPPFRKRPHNRPYRREFPHAHLSDAQLLALDPDLIQGAILLRLAQSHSNQEIYQLINANHHPGFDLDDKEQQQQRVKSVNVITKRLTHAVKAASRSTGRSEREIRVQIAEAKRRRGVVHKGKVDVGVYG